MGLGPRQRRQLIVIGLVGAGTVFLYLVRGILFPFWLALIFAYISNPAVVRLEQREVPRPVAIVLIYTLSGVIIGLSAYYLVPTLTHEMDQVVRVLPKHTQELSQLGNSLLARIERARLPVDLEEVIREGALRVEAVVDSFLRRLLDLVLGAFSQLPSIFLAPILAFYILRDWEQIRDTGKQLIPVAYRGEVEELVVQINAVLNGFIRGQLVVSALVGAFIALGLFFLKVRFSLLLGLVAGLFNVIPYLGPLIGGLPAVSLALLDSPWKAIWAVVLFVLVNNLEASFLVPRIVGDQVGLHPLVVIFAVLSGGHLFGVVGMLLAVPAAAVGRVLLGFILRKLL